MTSLRKAVRILTLKLNYMCYSAILPTVVSESQSQSELLSLTYIFNRWLNLLNKYGRLDQANLGNDMLILEKVITVKGLRKDIKRVITRCRNYALNELVFRKDIMKALTVALKLLCDALEDKTVAKVKANHDDQGMTERYRYLVRKLAKEKLHHSGQEIMFTDSSVDSSETNKLVRRIIEKRAAQVVHKYTSKRDRESNRFRQSVRRATSFSLYHKAFTEYNPKLRAPGTHWRLFYRAGKGKVLKAKKAYSTYEEAIEACHVYQLSHPDDTRPTSVYKCAHCGKWHIGHMFELAVVESTPLNSEIC